MIPSSIMFGMYSRTLINPHDAGPTPSSTPAPVRGATAAAAYEE